MLESWVSLCSPVPLFKLVSVPDWSNNVIACSCNKAVHFQIFISLPSTLVGNAQKLPFYKIPYYVSWKLAGFPCVTTVPVLELGSDSSSVILFVWIWTCHLNSQSLSFTCITFYLYYTTKSNPVSCSELLQDSNVMMLGKVHWKLSNTSLEFHKSYMMTSQSWYLEWMFL